MAAPQVNTVCIAPAPHPSSPPTSAPRTRRRWTIAASSETFKGLVRRLTIRRRSSREEEPSLPRVSRVNRILSPGRASRQEPNLQVNTSSPDINNDVTSVRDASESVERRTAGREASERPATGTSKSQSFPSTTDLGGEERDVPRRTPGTRKLRRKSRTSTPFTVLITRYKRTNSKVPKTTPPPSTLSLASPSSRCDEVSRSVATQPRDEEPSSIIPHCSRADQTPADSNAKKAEQTATPPISDEVEKLQRDLATSRSRVAELQKRCDAQSRDLECTNDFLHSADKSSDSDIIRALQRLNAEVQQDTTYMADCLVQDFVFKNVTTNPTEEQISARQKASVSIGQALVQSFGTMTPEDIPMFLEIAFQAFLTSALCETASSWTIEPGQNTFLSEIYQRLRRAEPQVISGLWRSLTRVHIPHTRATDPYSLVTEILVGLSDIVVAAGCTASQADIISKVASRFENKVSSLVSLAGRLNGLFGEVISSDFEVFVVRPGDKFEGKQMEDTGGGREEIQKASVLCATQLGLMKQIPVGTLWEKGKKQKMMVLKAKVLLESFLITDYN